ncbi:Response regulator receiver domain-containing protein [Natronoarchaeum philippinense]|uniref:Response regulator receiver domain-containing protein n=1 Tax=Natronoarchaeum philippinense TaxID=558529 RepID=A0A285NTK5_NATPI|nr:response regulator [Natronoarchaeum philippinense]SNZ12824.1 Response regulator receiver domain-containing protein [Natronoarchaeum philippinense]
MTEAPAGTSEDGPQVDVLIVEDESQVAQLYATWLEDDYRVHVADGGEAALTAWDDEIDVLLLDRRMPNVSGDDVLAALRDRGAECPVAVVTAIDPDLDVVEMGFDEYLVKPIDRDTLVGTVERLLARTKYQDGLQEYFANVSKRSVLEKHVTDAELQRSDAYVRLERRIEEIEGDLEATLYRFEDRDFRSVFREFEQPNSE